MGSDSDSDSDGFGSLKRQGTLPRGSSFQPSQPGAPTTHDSDSDSDGFGELAPDPGLLTTNSRDSNDFQPTTADESDISSSQGSRSASQRPESQGSLDEARYDLRAPTGSLEGPTHHELNREALESWLYPVDMPVREYQRNIVAKALVKNLVVALPTGLGKTFIATVVMLNWLRWTVNAKILFIAPTRPLVAQQVRSFLEISGVPISQVSALLESVVPRRMRAEEWATKRVFFSTAQTVDNDLSGGLVNPRDIVLVVLDEAHKATGNHSYVNVVDQIRRVNPSFRVLALTATPSGKLDGVQTVIDNLGIAQTEIRTEDSLDIRRYTHSRQVERVVVDLSPEQDQLLDLVSDALRDHTDMLYKYGLVQVSDASEISHYGLLSAMNRLRVAQRGNSGMKFAALAAAGFVLRVVYAIGLLKTHGIFPFYARIRQFDDEIKLSKGKNARRLLGKDSWHQILRMCRRWVFEDDEKTRRRDFVGHPKLAHLVDIISDFFLQHSADSRVIVFAELRESAAEIAWILSIHCPEFVRASLFVGQATKQDGSGSGVRGMTQKQQQELLTQFKRGDINVLIATSIAEEGLDIGQVDMIACYDQSQSPIRSIQRMGRTGRARNGHVYMLMTNKEEQKLANALDGHKFIRDRINPSPATRSGSGSSNSVLELRYHPPVRIIPRAVVPKYEEMHIVVPPENEAALSTGDIILALKPKPIRKARSRSNADGGTKRRRKNPDAEPVEAPESTRQLEQFGFRAANEVEVVDDRTGRE